MIRAILPCQEDWYGRPHGSLTFRMTQLITVHGSFGYFLCKIRKRDMERCPHCGGDSDDTDHTIAICPSWEEERRELVEVVGNNLEMGTLVPRMVRLEKVWEAVQNFCRESDEEKGSRRAGKAGNKWHSSGFPAKGPRGGVIR